MYHSYLPPQRSQGGKALPRILGLFAITALLGLGIWQLSNKGPQAEHKLTHAPESGPLERNPATTNISSLSAYPPVPPSASATGDLIRDPSLTPAIAPSLRGSEVDAEFHFDQNGQLVNDLALRHYFDYFLSTIGELSLEEIRQALAEDLFQRLEPAQADQAIRVLERYLEYLAAAQELSTGGDVAARFAQLVDLRRRVLGDDLADGFFAQEETYTRTVLREQEIIQNNQLSLEQRQQELEQLHRDLPPELRQSREEAIAHHLVLEQQQQFEQLQLDPAQRHAERAALFGEEAAQRLAQLDQQRQQWQQRLDTYQQQRNALLAQGESEEQIAALRQQLFDEAEQRRVLALEEVGFPDPEQYN